LIDSFYREETRSLDVTDYYPKTLDALDSDIRVRLGWYYFDKTQFRPAYDLKHDDRTRWERLLMRAPRYIDGVFLHYFPDRHGPTDQ
jgi:hypothetical protein